jgi:NAD(P)-dependent dehydrogenase (short-subunit alcohol dehydrogenase family)
MQEHLDAESFGNALLESEAFDEWAQHFTMNVSSLYFVSVAFLGLLARGACFRGSNQTSSIINITSISGLVKLAQDHVCVSVQSW